MNEREVLLDMFSRVAENVSEVVEGLSVEELACSWDPPVTMGVRLVSIVDDDAQHIGQAAYVRGLLRQL